MIKTLGWQTAFIILVLLFFLSIVIGVFEFYIKRTLQSDIDKQSAIFQSKLNKVEQKLQANLDTKIHITKAKYDLEFEIYQQLWSQVNTVIEIISNYRIYLSHRFDTEPPSEKISEELKEELSDYLPPEFFSEYDFFAHGLINKSIDAYLELNKTINKSSPFFADNVMFSINMFLKRVPSLSFIERSNKEEIIKELDRLKEARSQLTSAFSKVEEAIRNRFVLMKYL